MNSLIITICTRRPLAESKDSGLFFFLDGHRCTDRDDWFEQGMLVVLRSSSHSDEVVKAFIGELIKQSNR